MREGYTSQAKKALAYAVRTAEKCGHNYVGTPSDRTSERGGWHSRHGAF